MKPVLIVEGKQYEVRVINYFKGEVESVMVSNGKTLVTYYDEQQAQSYVENPLKLNMDECLKWVGRYEPIYQTIDKVLVDKGQELQELAIEFTESSIAQPFATEGLKEKYKLLQREQMGIIDAQEIVYGFMEDDVDLSGGDSNATE